MKIEISSLHGYRIIRIQEELKVVSDLSELQYLIEGYMKIGPCFVAVSFTDTSYIYSGAIAVLINCYKKISGRNGDLCLIEPNQEINSVFDIINLDKLIRIYKSDKDLPEQEKAQS